MRSAGPRTQRNATHGRRREIKTPAGERDDEVLPARADKFKTTLALPAQVVFAASDETDDMERDEGGRRRSESEPAIETGGVLFTGELGFVC